MVLSYKLQPFQLNIYDIEHSGEIPVKVDLAHFIGDPGRFEGRFRLGQDGTIVLSYALDNRFQRQTCIGYLLSDQVLKRFFIGFRCQKR